MPARAFDTADVPAFDPEHHVVLIPPDLAFRHTAVDEAVARTAHPTWVVVIEHVIDGRIEPGHASETEDAIERVWDAWTFDPRFDPKESNLAVLALDDREVRLRAGTRWDLEMGLANDKLLPFIDRNFLPRATTGDLDGGLAAMVGALDRHITGTLQFRSNVRYASVTGLGFAGVGLPTFTLLAFVARGRSARQRFEGAVAQRRLTLERAEQRWAELGLDVELRDRVVALKLRGPRTRELTGQVTAALDRIRVGLDALRRRIDDVVRDTSAGPLSTAGWRAGAEALDAPFDHDTGPGTGLFEPERRTVKIDPASFEAELDQHWAEARAGWDRVLDAVAASMRTASDDLPVADLARITAALVAAGLPTGWVADHPLAGGTTDAWDRLDALRREDPVAYLDAIEAAIAVDDALEERVAALIGAFDAARAERAEAEGVEIAHLATVHGRGPGDTDDPDPAHAERDADSAFAAFEAAIAHPPARAAELAHAAEAVLALGSEAIAHAEALHALRVEITDAVRSADQTVAATDRQVDDLQARLEDAQRRIRQALTHHAPASIAGATSELGEASVDVAQARTTVELARAALAERRHLYATRLARRAAGERTEALTDLRELETALSAADDAKAKAEALFATLGEVRRRHASAFPAAAYADGDRQLATLQASWGAPGDWNARLAAITAVLAAWQAARAHAEREAQRAAEQARAAARAAERQRAAMTRSRSTHFGSSSRSTGSAYRSSSSSTHRPASRPSTPAFRPSPSAGRSFGSSGRSAGRKF